MSRREFAAVLRWFGPALALVLLVATGALLALLWSEPARPLGNPVAADAIAAAGFAAWSAVGGFVAARRRGNRVGLILLAAGLAAQTWVLGSYYAAFGLLVRPGSVPGAELAALAYVWLPMVAFGLAFTFLFLLFPDGKLPGPRWRPLAWFAGAGLGFWTFTWGTAPGPLGGAFADVDNPAGIDLVGRIDPGAGWLLFVFAVLGSVTAAVVRLRRSAGAERQQLKWFTYAATMVALTWLVVTVGSEFGSPFTFVGGLLFPATVFAIPLAVFIAIFRHQLYDIDVVISRTIVFAVLAVVVTGGYVAAVAGVGALVGRAGDVSLGRAVLATALVAVAFQPARVRAQRLADRLVYGRRATPYQVLTGLARQMGETYAADDLSPHVARTLAEGVGAARAEVWLVVDRKLRRVASWPVTDEPSPALPLAGDRGIPDLPAVGEVSAVRHRGGLVGALAVSPPPGHAMSAADRELLADLATQVGAALDNLRLIEELKASRQRIVTAQDEERKRIERDIHDGIQQRLVSLSLALRMTRATLGSTANGDTAEALDKAASETREALDELRRLARGIHPAIVTEGGLTAALDSLAERSSVPAAVAGVPQERFPAPVEVTVYYVVAEALANVAKHAHASQVQVTVDRIGPTVRVTVADDGIGETAPGAGTGLTGLADRVAALDGTFAIECAPGQGTTLRAEIPCGSS